MKKYSSFFVAMEPPKSYDARKKERSEKEAVKKEKVDGTFLQSLNWMEVLNEQPAEIPEKIDLRQKYRIGEGTARRRRNTAAARGAKKAVKSAANATAEFPEKSEYPEYFDEPEYPEGPESTEESEFTGGPDISAEHGSYAQYENSDGDQSAGAEASADTNLSNEPAEERKHTLWKKAASVFTPELQKTLLVIRLAAASLLFAAAILLGSLSDLTVPLLLLSAILAGVDLVVNAIQCIVSGIVFSSALIVTVSFVISFLLGFWQEAVAMLLLYQIGSLLTKALKDVVSHSAIRLVDFRETHIREQLNELFNSEGVDYINTEAHMRYSAIKVLTAMILFCVLYAAIFPLISYYRTTVILHRAAVVLLLCTPDSVLTAMSVTGRTGLCTAASYGTVFRNAAILEQIGDCRTLLFDRSFLFRKEKSKITSVSSEKLDEETFCRLIFHLVHPSGQAFAETVTETYTYEYDPDLITEFHEESGGVSGKINGMTLDFGTESYLMKRDINIRERKGSGPDIRPAGAGYGSTAEGNLTENGVSADPAYREERETAVPRYNNEQEAASAVHYLLYLDGKFGGEVQISNNTFEDISDLLHEFRMDGINKCILITEESAEEISSYAELNGFDEVYAAIDADSKQALIDELSAADSGRNILITSDEEIRGPEDSVTILIGEDLKDANAVTMPHRFAGISGLITLSRRMKQIASENAVIAFAAKAMLIFMSLTGYCNLWMAVLGETAAAIFTVYNTRRISSSSLINTLINK